MRASSAVPVLVVLLGAGTAVPARAQAQPPVGVRAAGMGGAFTAVADDASATFWNPAGLATGAFFSLVLDRNSLDRGSATLISLGTLAGGVGHELRNIAQIQVAAVDELAGAIRANEDVAAFAKSILPDLERVGEHITAHGNRLMQLARPGPDHVSPIDLNAVVRDVAAMLKLAGKLGRVELVLRLPTNPVIVTVNRTSIEQIFVNLIINAVDANGETGTVRVEVQPSGNRVQCEVADTGVGIPPELMDKIFEPFFTTKGENGTGLGLPVVRMIIISYGGELRIDSAVGRGTTFSFDLPA